jgi:hypothetical protein
MVLCRWKRIRKGALRGFANVSLPNGLEIDDVAVLETAGKAWAALPARPVITEDGRIARLPGSSKLHYVTHLRWRDREQAAAFSRRVVELVRAADPDACDAVP